jgi:glucose-1-phosphate thymidylyltransferase
MDKAVILARGLGTRMQREDPDAALSEQQASVARSGVKGLIPIDRPFLDYVMHGLAEAGYRQVCLIVGPEHEEAREYYTEQVVPRRISIDFAVQQEPLGTADAVAAAEEFAGDDPFVVINSDNYYPVDALAGLREFGSFGLALFDREKMVSQSNVSEERLRRFAVARVDDGHLAEILEKPDEATWSALPRPIWISMNCWRFGPAIFKACRNIKPSPRGELEITDAVQYTIDVLGHRYRVLESDGAVLDLTSRADIAPVAAKLADVKVNL